MDKMNIKEWADKKDKESRETIKTYINSGIPPKQAVKIVLETSMLGAGYKAQIIHDFVGFSVDL